MKTWLLNRWDAFRSGFWFVPIVLLLMAVVLSLLLPALDRRIAGRTWVGSVWTASTPASARLSLSSIAGAMITVTGVVFSITVVALTSTASQFGSRLLRTMMESKLTQLALGSLLATGLYCLLVLHRVQDAGDVVFVPHLSVVVGILSAIVSMGVFIAFIHHVGARLQAPNLVHSVAEDLFAAVDRIYPEEIGAASEVPPTIDLSARVWALGESYSVVKARRHGYLQAIDGDGLLRLAVESDVIVYVTCRPGAFVYEQAILARLWSTKPPDDELIAALRRCFVIGRTRTPRQDLECAVVELVEIAVRALSPGINDPFTARACLDYLGAALAKFVTRVLPAPIREDPKGKARVLTEMLSFSMVLQTAFSMILHYGRSHPAILEGVLTAISRIVPHVSSDEQRVALRDIVSYVKAMVERHDPDEWKPAGGLRECDEILESIHASLKEAKR